MPTGYHEDHRSLKHIARLVAGGTFPINRFYEIAAERLVDSERAERLVIDAKAQIDAEREAERQAAAAVLEYMHPRLPLITAGRWIAQSVGENAVLVKPQPIGVKVGCIDV